MTRLSQIHHCIFNAYRLAANFFAVKKVLLDHSLPLRNLSPSFTSLYREEVKLLEAGEQLDVENEECYPMKTHGVGSIGCGLCRKMRTGEGGSRRW